MLDAGGEDAAEGGQREEREGPQDDALAAEGVGNGAVPERHGGEGMR